MLQQPYIVAEIGQNHNGDVYTAFRLVSAAVKAGADCVKFQLRDAEREFSKVQLSMPHPAEEHAFGSTYWEHRKALDLSIRDLEHVKHRIDYNRLQVDFAVTPCYVEAVKKLRHFEMPFWKVASKDNGNVPLWDEIMKYKRPEQPLVMSCEKDAQLWADADIYCYCVPEYPAPLERFDLSKLAEWRAFKPTGFSDHSGIPYLGPAAAALGVTYFEAHLTFSKEMKGRDHRASLTPDEFAQWAAGIRAAYQATGVRSGSVVA